MPDTTYVFELENFKGLNLRVDPGALDQRELSEAINVNIDTAGDIVKRTGLEKTHNGTTLGANATVILGHFLTDTISQLIVKSGSNVYYSTDGTNFTLLGTYSDATWGVQYAGNFYILRSGNVMVLWNGTTASNITGSPSGTFGLIYKERLFVLNTIAAGTLSARLYFSNAGDLSATGWPGTNFFDIQPGDGDYLICLAVVQDLLLIFKGKATWALYVQGQLTDWIIRTINPEVGCISKYALRHVQGYLYISSYQGIYRTDGASFNDISQEIAPVFVNRIVNTTTVNIDAMGLWGDQLICLISPNSGVKVYYVFNYRIGAWTQWSFASGFLPQTFTEVRSVSLGTGLYAGDGATSGFVLRYGSTSFTDAGVSYTVSIKTGDLDLDLSVRYKRLSTHYKRGKWVGIDTIGLATLTVTNTANGIDQTPLTANSLATRSFIKLQGPGFFVSWKISISTTSTSSFKILRISLHHHTHRGLIKANT